MRNAKQIDGASVPPNSAPSDKNVAGVKMISLRIVISLMRRITEAMGSRYARIMEDRASRNTTPTSGRPFEHEQSATRSLGIPQLGQRILEAAKRVPALSSPINE